MIDLAISYAEELSKIKAYIEESNKKNLHVKFYPRIEDDTLVSISLRF